MTTDTKRLKEFATKCAGIELYGHLECDSKTWTLCDHEGEVLELRRRDQRTLHLAEYFMQAKPLVVRDLIYQNEDLLEKVETLTKEITPYRRMMLSACTQLGQIGEALGLSMDDDADTMLGTIAANSQALRCNQEAGKILAASNKALFDDLVIAAETLRRYETLHRAKNTEDSLKKAEVNAELASRFEATLVHAGQSQGLDIPDFTPGNGNKARRRAAALGIDYDTAAKVSQE